jgi:hypothetical protein
LAKNGKDARVCADAEGKSQNRHGGEAGGLQQHAEAKAQVLEQGLKEWQAAGIAILHFRLLSAAKTQQSLPARFLRRKAALQIFFDGEVQVSGHFCIEAAVVLRVAKEGEQALAQLSQPVHHFSLIPSWIGGIFVFMNIFTRNARRLMDQRVRRVLPRRQARHAKRTPFAEPSESQAYRHPQHEESGPIHEALPELAGAAAHEYPRSDQFS